MPPEAAAATASCLFRGHQGATDAAILTPRSEHQVLSQPRLMADVEWRRSSGCLLPFPNAPDTVFCEMDDPKLIVAIVGGAFGLLGTLVSLLVAFSHERMKHGLARDLSKYAAELQAERDAKTRLAEKEQLTSAFRDPLLHAAYDLQSRMFNIARQGFLQVYWSSGDARQKQYATENTLFLIAQYLGWTELVRQELRFIALKADSETQKLRSLQDQLYSIFQTDRHGANFQIFAGDQRAIGELMIVPSVAPARILGYGAFLISRPSALEQWLGPLRDDLVALASGPQPQDQRLTEVQRTLVSVLELLDEGGVYFPQDKRTRLWRSQYRSVWRAGDTAHFIVDRRLPQTNAQRAVQQSWEGRARSARSLDRVWRTEEPLDTFDPISSMKWLAVQE